MDGGSAAAATAALRAWACRRQTVGAQAGTIAHFVHHTSPGETGQAHFAAKFTRAAREHGRVSVLPA